MTVRMMEAADIPGGLALSRAERWPHRAEDWQMMLRLGTGVVAEVGGEIIGTTLWFPTGPDSATIGMVIVSKQFRGAGIGRLIFDAALERLGDKALLLNATSVAVPLYRKFGFQGVAEIVQHQGAAFAVPVAPLEPGERLRPVGLSDHDRVTQMVQDATGLSRDAVIADLFENAQVVALDRAGELTGVAFFRRFGHGSVVGPVVVPDAGRAKVLISHWLGSRAGEFIRLDIPAECGLGDWLDGLGLLRVDGVVTMARGAPPPAPVGPARSFAIVSQALG